MSLCSIDDDDEIVAHLLPCGHDLHNACLKPWVERANSCPICRAKFNSVELRQAIGGTVIDSYAVQDKVQEAEIDPTMVLEDELFSVEVWEPCIVCGATDNAHSQMYCDGCDKTVHVFCAGYDDAPEVWYCESCLVDIESDAALPGLPAAVRRRPRQQRNINAPAGRRLGRGRRANTDTSWARVWQEVSRRLDLDLDFPFDDDEPTRDTRTPQQRREFQQWQRRFEVADRQGVTNRLRDIATNSHSSHTAAAPESQEELRAWNAFDKARELHEPNSRKRKATASPASPREPEAETEPRKLKRPRLRRPAPNAGSPPAESSHTAAQRGAEGTTFLSSLLREVENNPSSAGSPGPSSAQYSPRNSSPARSPGSSGYGSPHAGSATPPMSPVAHPSSPPNPLFSPFSPAVASQDLEPPSSRARPRGRRRDHHDSGYDENYHSGVDAASPSRNMSYSAKEEIQRMVKMTLRPRYLEKTINKDQYTDINRSVSRKMYELVGDASALADQGARERWQEMAATEVQSAIDGLAAEAASPV